jgi:hypothetical protein
VSPRTIAREIRIVGCTVIEHEYGHLAGLGHSEDPAQRHLLADGLHRSAMPQAVPAANGAYGGAGASDGPTISLCRSSAERRTYAGVWWARALRGGFHGARWGTSV